jgi:hypothetical protein
VQLELPETVKQREEVAWYRSLPLSGDSQVTACSLVDVDKSLTASQGPGDGFHHNFNPLYLNSILSPSV